MMRISESRRLREICRLRLVYGRFLEQCQGLRWGSGSANGVELRIICLCLLPVPSLNKLLRQILRVD
jgi:hypothetical protein